jgi:hypothetical protein
MGKERKKKKTREVLGCLCAFEGRAVRKAVRGKRWQNHPADHAVTEAALVNVAHPR